MLNVQLNFVEDSLIIKVFLEPIAKVLVRHDVVLSAQTLTVAFPIQWCSDDGAFLVMIKVTLRCFDGGHLTGRMSRAAVIVCVALCFGGIEMNPQVIVLNDSHMYVCARWQKTVQRVFSRLSRSVGSFFFKLRFEL